jgi:hypothetical protein
LIHVFSPLPSESSGFVRVSSQFNTKYRRHIAIGSMQIKPAHDMPRNCSGVSLFRQCDSSFDIQMAFHYFAL